jgi:hypothetical protein
LPVGAIPPLNRESHSTQQINHIQLANDIQHIDKTNGFLFHDRVHVVYFSGDDVFKNHHFFVSETEILFNDVFQLLEMFESCSTEASRKNFESPQINIFIE